MSSMTFAPVLVEAPIVDPLPYGLLSAAAVIPHGGADEDRIGLGIQYLGTYCGEATDTGGVCEDLGTMTGAVNTSRHLTLDSTGAPDGIYYVLWGDEAPDTAPAKLEGIDGAGHTYASAGDYTVIVTGPRSYRAVQSVHVNTSTSSGPFTFTPGVSKSAVDGIDIVSGYPFTVLSAFECKGLGGNFDDAQARVTRMLQMGESRAVERVLARTMVRDPNTVPLTVTPMPPVDAIGELEQYAAANYPGRATLHITRKLGTILASKQSILRAGRGLETMQGSRIASGGGYLPLSEPTPDESDPVPDNATDVQWAYVTGEVAAHQGSIHAYEPQMFNGSGNSDNTFLALAERTYVVTYECLIAAVPVTVTSAA